VLATMLVAALSVHLKNGFFAQNNGFELAFLYAVGITLFATQAA
jgi:uncharacterized membrane protein YphA (DoxX/SURF4 family)